jgi:hypothetical protein
VRRARHRVGTGRGTAGHDGPPGRVGGLAAQRPATRIPALPGDFHG